MNYQRMKKEEFLLHCELRIMNSLNDDIIAPRVQMMGYSPEKIKEGKKLLDEAKELSSKQTKEYGDVDAAFDARDNLKHEAHKEYMKLLTLSKLTFKNNTGAQVTLKLNGRRASTISGWIKETRSFYHNLLANPDWVIAIGQYGIKEENLKNAQNQVEEVTKMAEIIMREKGDAQNATEERDAKYEELYEWVSDYEIVAKIALSDNPQLLEKLGIVVK